MSAKRLIVCGGNGFVGSRICKYAVARGRSGEPKWGAVGPSATPPPWARKVSWERGDVLRPASYAPLLKGADFVVHSLGILLEADYKGVVSGEVSPVAGLRRLLGAAPPAAAAAAADRPTYESMNRDSALALAAEAAREDVSAFAYISAASGAPGLPARYLSTKREAESVIASRFPRMRGLFLRPPFLYDSSRPVTVGMAAVTGLGAAFNGFTRGVFGGFMGAAGIKPLKVDIVAEAVVEGLGDDAVSGPLEPPEIEELANKYWRKSML
ncbi:hypothetical protein GGS23DRAFT_591847 [Durotheca rogersii]|uniref:uncharacterized protein n=1 Tax=Durotheca rogersii TaxID=419775 RepID=UPI00221EAD18|nr:uncharacterized protein GGS23DRAFT_591847 [Durotheca rogersii]KAI5868047.1 hypothetical protein GGS23DRAFT_591847 [Durotheca rogersii]